MKKSSTSRIISSIFLRYFAILALGYFIFSNLFYELALKLTIKPLFWVLSLFYPVSLSFNTILLGHKIIEIIPACVAISAYFLILALNLLTPNIRRRFFSILLALILLFLFNFLRLFILSILFLEDYIYFDLVHKSFWYSLSILLVLGIWFFIAYLFKVKTTPVYTDFKTLIKLLKD